MEGATFRHFFGWVRILSKTFFFRFLESRKKQRKIGIIEISMEISYRFHQNFRNFVPCFYFDDVEYGFCVFNQVGYPIDKSTIKSNHMWFGYESIRNLLERGQLFDRRGGTMTVSFTIVGGEEKLEVRKCGVRLVYKGDETSTYCTFPHGVLFPGRRR